MCGRRAGVVERLEAAARGRLADDLIQTASALRCQHPGSRQAMTRPGSRPATASDFQVGVSVASPLRPPRVRGRAPLFLAIALVCVAVTVCTLGAASQPVGRIAARWPALELARMDARLPPRPLRAVGRAVRGRRAVLILRVTPGEPFLPLFASSSAASTAGRHRRAALPAVDGRRSRACSGPNARRRPRPRAGHRARAHDHRPRRRRAWRASAAALARANSTDVMTVVSKPARALAGESIRGALGLDARRPTSRCRAGASRRPRRAGALLRGHKGILTTRAR
jgi:hypothetical protein